MRRSISSASNFSISIAVCPSWIEMPTKLSTAVWYSGEPTLDALRLAGGPGGVDHRRALGPVVRAPAAGLQFDQRAEARDLADGEARRLRQCGSRDTRRLGEA